MAKMMVRLFDAERKQLDDVVDVVVSDTRTSTTRVQLRHERGKKTLAIDNLQPNETYLVQVFPMAHRPVQQFASTQDDVPANVHLFTPIHPDRAVATFPAYAQLDQGLKDILDKSTLEADPDAAPITTVGATPGEQLYAGLADLQKAGLLNVYRKLASTQVGGVSGSQYLNDLYRIRADRFFANVRVDFRDQVKTEVKGQRFHKVDGALHAPPADFMSDDSFKTGESYGNLQLTFFASAATPLKFRIDADIDDAGGIGHAFQVLRNWLTKGATHPYDIHQLLSFHQALKPQYDLTV